MLESIATVSVLGGVFGIVLAIANRKLAVEIDPRIEQILNLLPGANCGSCGYPGCQGLAEAIAAGRTGISPCLACPPANKSAIAKIMGINDDIQEDPSMRRVCRVACNGCKINAPKNYDYQGIKDCHLVSKYFGGPANCHFGCLGFGSCVNACPFDAISMGENGLPIIDYDKCTGCGICAQQCPQNVLKITLASAKIQLKCNNRDKGKAAMQDCSVSCISCGICQRNCPTQAIKLVEDSNGSLPVIDYSKCIECGLCVEKCPRHCLHLIDTITPNMDQTLILKHRQKNSCTSCAMKSSCSINKM